MCFYFVMIYEVYYLKVYYLKAAVLFQFSKICANIANMGYGEQMGKLDLHRSPSTGLI